MKFKSLVVFCLLLVLLSGCSQEDFSQCSNYSDSILEIKEVLSYSITINILSIYPTIWAIMVVRKILL